jgi:hypothetical protein
MTSNDDIKIIEGVIQSYLDGLYESDAGKIASVLSNQRANQRHNRRRTGYHAPSLPRHDHVLTIDLISPTMAYVKLNCAIPPRFFTDQLSLLKIDGRWQVAQKVFMTEMRE